jgi:uncharacterized protein (DUF1697 family)
MTYAYHEVDPSSAYSILTTGLKCKSRGDKGDDKGIIMTDAYLDERRPDSVRQANVSRDENVYAYVSADGNIYDITNGSLVDIDTFVSTSDQTVLRLNLNSDRCFVSDLNLYDTIKVRIHDTKKANELEALAQQYWAGLTPLSQFDPTMIARPEIMITYDISPDDITSMSPHQIQYLALLRGVNVGGNGLLSMPLLRQVLSDAGLDNVRTYIQSGNILFTSANTDRQDLTRIIHDCIAATFQLDVSIAIFTKDEWQNIIDSAPNWWGTDPEWKHNLLALLPPTTATETVAAIGTLKPDIEAVEAGEGVVYQSVSFKLFGRTTTGKLAAKPIYKKMTIRNYNTATKLLTLLYQE